MFQREGAQSDAVRSGPFSLRVWHRFAPILVLIVCHPELPRRSSIKAPFSLCFYWAAWGAKQLSSIISILQLDAGLQLPR